jgi:zinc protease
MHRTTVRWQGLELELWEGRLGNGLTVLAHPDASAPMVSVHVGYHVGSAREEPGRTGFAHLFEHLLFEGSEHVPKGGHFRHVTEAGGTLNGNTSFDRTVYFETLPSNQLELALWLESDRMGFLLPAMTREKLDNQRDVVRNEKRQNYELKPYAKSWEPLMAALFPPGHPYAHLPIGSHEDLIAATLDDVASFFRRWYGPDNALLAIGGDVEPGRAFEAAERWFGAIPRGPELAPIGRCNVALERERRLVIEDQVQLPQLTLAWPAVDFASVDAPALQMLAMVLSASRASVLDKALTIDALLARSVSAGAMLGEVSGDLSITITAAVGVRLAELEARTRDLLADLVARGVDPGLLERMKTRLESGFVGRLEDLSQRTNALALARLLRGDAAEVFREVERALAVSAEQVRDVARRYLVERPPVAVEVVPAPAETGPR